MNIGELPEKFEDTDDINAIKNTMKESGEDSARKINEARDQTSNEILQTLNLPLSSKNSKKIVNVLNPAVLAKATKSGLKWSIRGGGALAVGLGLYTVAQAPQTGPHDLDAKVFTQPYSEVVDEFLENQDTSNGEKWVKPEGISYSDSHFSKLGNISYESPALMKIKIQDGRTMVVDTGWVDFDGENYSVISLKDTLTHNNDLLSEGTDVQAKTLWYMVGTTAANESKFASDSAQTMRMLPDSIYQTLGKEVSQSALKVKKNTLDDYTPEEQEKMLHQLANFEIIPQSRSRGVFNNTNHGSEYIALYKLYNYDTPEDFIADFKNGKIETKGEVGVSLGMILITHIRSKTQIEEHEAEEVMTSLKNNGVYISKDRGARAKRLRDGFNIDTSKGAIITNDTVANLYPTNVNRSIHDSRIQMLVNLKAFNTGQYDKLINVDGVVGNGTIATAEELGYSDITIYDNNPDLSTSQMQELEKELLIWSKDMYRLYRDNVSDDTSKVNLSTEEEEKLYQSMVMNLDSKWVAYRTIRYYLMKNNKIDEKEAIEEAFENFTSRATPTSKTDFLELLSYYSKKENIEKKFGKDSRRYLLDVTQTNILVQNYGKYNSYMVDNYAPPSYSTNETNTGGRAFNNLYGDYIEKYNPNSND